MIKDHVSEIYINDLDPSVFAFWRSILFQTPEFMKLLCETPITSQEWIKQKLIHKNGAEGDKLRLGFATFFLNRTNYSGILNGGMIGGKNQNGKWKIDSRFNRIALQQRIERVISLKDRIHISNEDALEFLKKRQFGSNSLIYLDPPYYYSGRRLYLNSYRPGDHSKVSEAVLKMKTPWIVSYDEVPEIRKLYRTVKSRRIQLLHTARQSRRGNEVLFFSPSLRIPRVTRDKV